MLKEERTLQGLQFLTLLHPSHHTFCSHSICYVATCSCVLHERWLLQTEYSCHIRTSLSPQNHQTRNVSFFFNDRPKHSFKMLGFIPNNKGKAIPLQAWTGPGGFQEAEDPRFQSAHEGGKFVSITHRPPLPPRKYSWYSFLLEAESIPGP